MTSPIKGPIVPLHLHTVYSVLDGASTIDQYVAWCKENGSPALGISDHGWCIGLHELHEKCSAAGLTSLPGCEFYLAPDFKDYQFSKKPYAYYHLTAWAVNEKGYRNLLKLGSTSFGSDSGPQFGRDKDGKPLKRVVTRWGDRKPRITFEELFQHHEGLVIGSGCLIGSINKALLNGEYDGAVKNALKLLEVFHGRFFVEIIPHKCTHDYDRKEKKFVLNECTDFATDGDLQRACNKWNIDFAKKYELPLLLTIDSHFVKPEQKKLQDVLLQNGSDDGWTFYNSYHMLSTDDAWEAWKEQMGGDVENQKLFTQAVENTHLIADVAKGFKISDPYHQPTVEYPEAIRVMEIPEAAKMKSLILDRIAFHGRMKWGDEKYIARLEQELKVICDNGMIDFAPYFIFLEKWATWTRENSILSAPGRGSGAGSLLCFLLKITHLDPFLYDLPFERFLSMGRLKRKKYPDIDWDLGDREILLAKLKEVYGDKMAQCSTHGTLKVKSAIKDACRVLKKWNSQDDKVDAITKSIANTPMGVKDIDFLVGYEDKEGNYHTGHLEQNDKLRDFFEEEPEVFDMVKQLLGIPRSVGRHASAYFISDEPIVNSVPTCDMSGYVCTQYTAEPAQKAGLIKFDFLRVNTLADIAACIRLVQQSKGYKVWEETYTVEGEEFLIFKGELPPEIIPFDRDFHLDMYQLPEDPLVLQAFADGRTESVFQFNTPALTGFCKRVGPTTLQDLSDIVALVRPGPLSAKLPDGDTMAESYIKCKNGTKQVSYIHPGMEPILKDTAGQIVYQEQIQRIFSDLLMYTAEEADYMREVLAKKKTQDLEKLIPEIKDRARVQGWTEEQAKTFADACIAASQYSFNRAHSASYAVVAYICQFLKTHFHLEWWTAVLKNAKVEDIRDKGYAVTVKDILEMPHVNGPTDTFVLDNGKIHCPLYIVERVGDSACGAILKARASGPFTSFFDFYDRVPKSAVDQTVFHNLIRTEAFRLIEPGKSVADLMIQYHGLRRCQELKIGKGKSGKDLFDSYTAFLATNPVLDVPELYQDRLELETQRIALLPIYRFEAQESFAKYLATQGFLLDHHGNMTYAAGRSSIFVAKNISVLQHVFTTTKIKNVGYLGLIKDMEEFTYVDKKTKKQVTACKVFIANDGTDIECVLWPTLYTRVGKPKMTKLAFAIGQIRESREPGKLTISVEDFLQF